MAHPNKIKGDIFERAVRDHARANGFPWAERTRAGYERDHGDLHLDPPSHGVIVQAKNWARLTLPEWLRGLGRQVADSGATHGVLVIKRRGDGDVGRSFAVMEFDAMLRLLRAAGYGTPLERDGLDIDATSATAQVQALQRDLDQLGRTKALDSSSATARRRA